MVRRYKLSDVRDSHLWGGTSVSCISHTLPKNQLNKKYIREVTHIPIALKF